MSYINRYKSEGLVALKRPLWKLFKVLHAVICCQEFQSCPQEISSVQLSDTIIVWSKQLHVTDMIQTDMPVKRFSWNWREEDVLQQFNENCVIWTVWNGLLIDKSDEQVKCRKLWIELKTFNSQRGELSAFHPITSLHSTSFTLSFHDHWHYSCWKDWLVTIWSS